MNFTTQDRASTRFQPLVINMSSIVESMKVGLNFSLIVIPKLVLVALGLVLVNAGALYLPYFAWRIWFPEKQNGATTVQGNVGEVGKKDMHDSSSRQSPKPADPEAASSCMLLSIIIAILEGIAIFSMKDGRPKIGWVLHAGNIAGLILGLGLGAALVVLVGGGFTKMVMVLDAQHQKEMKAKLNEENVKEIGKGWEKLELKDEEGEKEKGQ
jgi:hypothetical protein